MEPAQVALLQNLLRQESRSLLQYAAESFPWSKAEDQAEIKAIRAMAQAEADAVTKLGRWLARQRVPLTFPGAYPMHFTSINFIAVLALAPRLIADQEQHIAAVAQVEAALAHDDGRALVRPLLDLKRAHLQKLRELQNAASPTAVA